MEERHPQVSTVKESRRRRQPDTLLPTPAGRFEYAVIVVPSSRLRTRPYLRHSSRGALVVCRVVSRSELGMNTRDVFLTCSTPKWRAIDRAFMVSHDITEVWRHVAEEGMYQSYKRATYLKEATQCGLSILSQRNQEDEGGIQWRPFQYP